jgi:hypothetical protein
VGYLFWLPDFLHKRHGLSLKDFGLPLVVVYLMADIGSIGGGWLSSSLIKRGWTINAGRKLAMLICALAVVPIVFAAQTSNLWVAVVLIGLAGSGAPGLVVQSVYDDVGHVPATCSRIGGWDRRMAGAIGGHDDRAPGRRDTRTNRAATCRSSSLPRRPTLWHYFSFIYCHQSSSPLNFNEHKKAQKAQKVFLFCSVLSCAFCG